MDHNFQMTCNNETDRAAIIQLLDADTQAYLARDYDAWAACWAQTPDTRRFLASVIGGMRVDEGWETLGRLHKENFSKHPKTDISPDQIQRRNMNIVIGSDMAWATFDQTGPDASDPLTLAGFQHEQRVLKKIDGEWKILCMVIMQRSIDHVHCPLIEVDASGRVLWMNTEAKKQLPDFPELTIRGDRLRARDNQRDIALQNMIADAHRFNDELLCYIPPDKAVQPVMLGENEFSVTQYCWISLKDTKVLISFEDYRLVEQKLGWAKQVYNFSSTQAQIVKLVVEGHDLSEIAEDLGITINTVRTHLQRAYDKSGARGRNALVRAVLNMEPPKG
ncbi:MAG: sigma factor-like helix-turn-helix DNA-binding protein [Hyphomicrobiales bacterium]